MTFCDKLHLVGCVRPTTPIGKGTLGQIAIKDTATVKDIKSLDCSKLTQVSMHELGHIYGLGDHDSMQPSIMNASQGHRACEPTEYDVVAIIVNYQSRTLSEEN